MSRLRWWLFVLLGALTLLCGTIGLIQYDRQHHPGTEHGFSPLYHAAQLLILHGPHLEGGVNGWIEAGRWFGLATLALGTVTLCGRRLRREWRLVQLAQWDGHHVICGCGAKGQELTRCLLKRDPAARIVVLDPELDSETVAELEARGVCVIARDASRPEALRAARVARAGEIVVITSEDERNVRIAATVREVCAANPAGRAPVYHVHLTDTDLREELQKLCETGASSGGCRLHFFDVFDDEARRVLLDVPLDGAGIAPDDRRGVHVVILGFGRMGRSLALRAAKMGHFANGRRLRISVIDRNAMREREPFLFRQPMLEGKQVCDLEFHQMEADSLVVRKRLEQWAAEPDTLLRVFECLDADTRGLEVGLRLRRLLAGHPHCALRVRFRSRHSLASILAAGADGAALAPFGMVEDTCGEMAFRDDRRDRLARAIHARFAQRREATTPRKPANDPALSEWEALTEDLRESNRQQADHIEIKLRAIGCALVDASDPRATVPQFSFAETETMAEMEHQRWNVERWLSGWHYGVPTDKPRRISEYLVPWSDLHDSIQKYDREAVGDIPALVKLCTPPQKVVRRGPLN